MSASLALRLIRATDFYGDLDIVSKPNLRALLKLSKLF